MEEFRQRSLFRKVLFSPPVFLLFFILAVWLAVQVWGAYQKSTRAVSRNEAVEGKISEIEQRRGDLRASMGQLGSEAGLEKELRKKFQIKKPGEDYVVIVDNPATATLPSETPNNQPKENFLSKLWNLLKF